MENVVLLNLCYDVPVKLASSHLWGLVIAGPVRGGSSFGQTEGSAGLELADGAVKIRLRREPAEAVPLTGTGFHWIQERPNNR